MRAILETRGLGGAEQRSRARELLDELGIRGMADQPAYTLSGGERTRLAAVFELYRIHDLFLAMNMLMIAYENNPAVWGDGQLLIPGGGNGVPDILDEIKYEIDWLLKMQRPGGEDLIDSLVAPERVVAGMLGELSPKAQLVEAAAAAQLAG